ncbi:metallophosphoesterase [Alloacidobacterium dinghuense]|uniref:Metallophosphoesterase n=1 Tax=Alloacidobacterium dinghuense TaxID=2763107 RepID=A0A7G8BP67_9BACT|nr:metallophosphoesterase [Alloacidobacterium dinghuense]QNI34337.1 metallophosphoesterase [Alloacidobacterium dinghuense]
MEVIAAEKERLLTRRQFLGISGLSVVGLAFYAGEIARHELDIVKRTIVIPGLPESFKGFRIVQISDIHFKEFTEASFLKLVLHEVNGLKPDLVALTGDFVSYGPIARYRSIGWAYECGELLTRIECPLRYAVLGNHDCIVSEAAAGDALTCHGIPLLENAAIPLEREGKRIWLAGVTDALESHIRPDFNRAIPKTAIRDDERVILLAHEPDILPTVAKYDVDLMLSGHTHGGQVRIPFLPPVQLPPLGKEYIEGHFQVGRTQLYVNRGIGTTGLPFRFNCPPEITVITLG